MCRHSRIDAILGGMVLYAAVLIACILFGKCYNMTADVATVTAWRPQARQLMALERAEFEILYGGARFGGKSAAGRAWMVEPGYYNNPDYVGLVVRKNHDDLKEWIHRTKRFYRCVGATVVGNPPEIRFPSGAVIFTGHLKDADAYEKYQGQEIQKILIEELTQIPRESDYERLIASCRSTVPGLKPQVFCTANPGGPGHAWVKQRFVDVARNKTYWPDTINPDGTTGRGRSRIFIPATADDNPIGMAADPEYVMFLNSIKDTALRRAWRYGDWDVFSGQFFDRWNSQVHVIPPVHIPESWQRFVGIDWGYSAPAAVVWVAVDTLNNHYVYRELYQTGQTPTRLAETILSRTSKDERISRWIADPSMWAKTQYGNAQGEQATAKSIQEQMAAAHLYIEKANNDRINGWQCLQELLYWDMNIKPKLYVFDNCKDTIRTIPSLVRDDKHVEDLDTTGDDHLADALRYVAMHTYKPVTRYDQKPQIQQIIDEITEPSDQWDNF